LYKSCTTFHCLPHPGGWFDQDAFLVAGLEAVIDAVDVKEKMEADRQKPPKSSAPRRT